MFLGNFSVYTSLAKVELLPVEMEEVIEEAVEMVKSGNLEVELGNEDVGAVDVAPIPPPPRPYGECSIVR